MVHVHCVWLFGTFYSLPSAHHEIDPIHVANRYATKFKVEGWPKKTQAPEIMAAYEHSAIE